MQTLKKECIVISVRPELVEGYEWVQFFSFETLRQAQGERGDGRVV